MKLKKNHIVKDPMKTVKRKRFKYKENSLSSAHGVPAWVILTVAGTALMLPGVLLLLAVPHFGYFMELLCKVLLGGGALIFTLVFGIALLSVALESIQMIEKWPFRESRTSLVVMASLLMITGLVATTSFSRAYVLLKDIGPAIHKEYHSVKGLVEIRDKTRHDITFEVDQMLFKTQRFEMRDRVMQQERTKVIFLPYSKYVIDMESIMP